MKIAAAGSAAPDIMNTMDVRQILSSGWLIALAIAVQASLPYVLGLLPRRTGIPAKPQPPRDAMWPHYWLGYLLLPLAYTHAWLVMSSHTGRAVNLAGVWVGTGALLLLCVQAGIGTALRFLGPKLKRRLRVAHLSAAVLIVCGSGIHAWLRP